jgi:hypothetical protein
MQVGDRVKLILDKERSPDNRWHGKTGRITRITADAASDVTGDAMDSLLFEVELDSGETPDIHFRWKDIVPLEEEEGTNQTEE